MKEQGEGWELGWHCWHLGVGQGKVEVKRLVVALDKVAGLINVTY